jgi:hypothetical protein
LLAADHFPSIKLEDWQADALLAVLNKYPWWSSDSKQFPALVEAPHTILLQQIISTIPVNYNWKSWGFMDKFAMVITIVGGCIPYTHNWQGARSWGRYLNPEELDDALAESLLFPTLEQFTDNLDAEIIQLDNAKPPAAPEMVALSDGRQNTQDSPTGATQDMAPRNVTQDFPNVIMDDDFFVDLSPMDLAVPREIANAVEEGGLHKSIINSSDGIVWVCCLTIFL